GSHRSGQILAQICPRRLGWEALSECSHIICVYFGTYALQRRRHRSTLSASHQWLPFRRERGGGHGYHGYRPFAEVRQGRHSQVMKLPFLLSQLLPHKRVTEGEALRAMLACGISPDEIAWSVGADGSFAFGRKHPDAPDLTDDQLQSLIEWTRRERIKLGFIGWETGPS
ncbi:MAG: hypothetical protein ACOYLS_13690, partial [Polymorphobacter sp.]